MKMMRRLIILCALPTALAAADHWVKFTRGPYEVLSDAGARAGRDTVVRFEEFRHALGEVVGEPNLQTQMPLRILVFKNAKGWANVEPVSKGRDRYNIVLDEKGVVMPATYAMLTELFLTSNGARLPAAFERGLIAFFSTYEVKGIHITVGAPPSQPDLDWARIHLLVADPQYFGRLRVLLFNLRKGSAEDPAYRNAFGKSAAEVEAQAKRHLAEGHFETTSISSLPMAEKDFPEREVSDADARLARADLLAGAQSAAEYESLLRDHVKVAEAEEGLGLMALREHHANDAKTHFAAAVAANTTSARCYIEYAKLEPDTGKAMQALLKAAGINPKLDEVFALMAQRDTDPQKRLAHWKAAAERDPRNAVYWQKLAECYLADHNYEGAAKAWTSGEQAAVDPVARERMRQARVAIEQQRLDYEEAEKRRQAEEDARELTALKQKALDNVRALEAKNKGPERKPDEKVVPWWDGPKPSATVSGSLKQVDCLAAGQALLTIAADGGKIMKLLVVSADKISIAAASGEATLGCGIQKSRRITVGYAPKVNAKLGSAGEVATIEFQ